MGQVGLAGDAFLALVGLGGEHVCPHHGIDVRLGIIVVDFLQDAFDAHSIAPAAVER
ncbi:MAG: hypothetical protein HYU32_00845 [candidate division NC10 bacterium]|nr:hypothetical protein [candidate division NC10 bacterium]